MEANASFVADQSRAAAEGKSMTNSQAKIGENRLETQDFGQEPGYVIYVYNLLNKEHIVEQPPLFPHFKIPACLAGERFSYTVLPAFVNEPFVRPATAEYYYKRKDGRISATSLLNPAAFPSTKWEGQLADWKSMDQTGNNLNAFGVFWSLVKPDETDKLQKQIDVFRIVVTKTMNVFAADGDRLAAGNDIKSISPWHHFAMDYLKRAAAWHTPSRHMVDCPNCGEPVIEGIAYHKNAFGERCIIDEVRYEKLMARNQARVVTQDPEPRQEIDEPDAPVLPVRKPRKKAAVAT